MIVGICQTDILFEDKKYNLIAAQDFISEAADKEADLVVFPEMSMTGYSMSPEKIYETLESSVTLDAMKKYAIEYQVAIGFGYVRKDHGKYTNRYMILNKQGDVICDYAKIHPFSYANEEKYYEKGDSLSFCTIDGIRICPLICYDLRFPEVFQAASLQADLIVVPANWGGTRNAHWKLLLQARALENQAFVIGVNRVGRDHSTCYVGNSMIVDPEGEIIERLDTQAGLIVVEVEKSRVDTYRKAFPLKKDRRPDLYLKL